MANTEDTVFDPSGTILSSNTEEVIKAVAKSKKKREVKPWQKVMVGGSAGIMLGAGTAYAASLFHHEGQGEVVTDSGVKVATHVDDSQSFGEAFQAAREEVGPGGVFHWHGGLYTSYTEEEWNSMSKEERDGFNEQIVSELREGEGDASHYAASQPHDTQAENHPTEHAEEHAAAGTSAPQGHQNDAPSQPQHHEEQAQHQQTTTHAEQQTAQAEHTDIGENTSAEVRLIGTEEMELPDGDVVTVGTVEVNDREVYFVDVDRDDVFDIMASDLNNNGRFDEGEVQDIRAEHLTVQGFNQELGEQNNSMAQHQEEPVEDFNNTADMASNDDAEAIDFMPDATPLV